ncbi:hypothetical protein [Roseicella aerolata]|uniref:Uncharacterized protein n=1 Tax=Roseicella aerolata TaxID=2883479 RepID=A0A9X1IGR2_9PROT|nr:hypothetical protein [Roseicella aerolata]MCB4824262.1 hypothetical protein [Roseicella aerolata]
MPRIFSVDFEAERPGDRAALRLDPLPDGKADPQLVPDALKFAREIEAVNFKIYAVLEKMERLGQYNLYVRQIEAAANCGLNSDAKDFLIANYMVEQIQRDFVALVGPRFRQVFIRKLTVVAGCVGLVSLLLGVFIDRLPSRVIDPQLLSLVQAGGYVMFGVCASVWLSTVLRNRQIDWNNLNLFDPDGFSAPWRLMIVAMVTLLFCVLLHLQIIDIAIAKNNLTAFMTVPTIGILVGFIGGLAEDSLTKLVIGRVGQTIATPKAAA